MSSSSLTLQEDITQVNNHHIKNNNTGLIIRDDNAGTSAPAVGVVDNNSINNNNNNIDSGKSLTTTSAMPPSMSKNQRKKILKEEKRIEKKRLEKLKHREEREKIAIENGRNLQQEQYDEEQRRIAGNSRHRIRKQTYWNNDKLPIVQSTFQIYIDCPWICMDDNKKDSNENDTRIVVDHTDDGNDIIDTNYNNKHNILSTLSHEVIQDVDETSIVPTIMKEVEVNNDTNGNNILVRKNATSEDENDDELLLCNTNKRKRLLITNPTNEQIQHGLYKQQYMTYKEIKSLATQIRNCYGSNKCHNMSSLLTVTGIISNSILDTLLHIDNGYTTNIWSSRGCICTSKSLEEYIIDKYYNTTNTETIHNQQQQQEFERNGTLNGTTSTITSSSSPTTSSTTGTKTLEIIYLTGDAEETLNDDIEINNHNVIYVIGGLVDRNRFPKAAYHRAQYIQQYFNNNSIHNNDTTTNDIDDNDHTNSSNNDSTTTVSNDNNDNDRQNEKHNNNNNKYIIKVRMAKLPLKNYILSMPSTPILTCLHVMNILLEYKKCHNWKQAFQNVIPIRKNPKYIE